MDRDPGRAQRTAALVAAYHSGGTVAYGWMRLQAGGPVQILAAGAALAGSTGGGDVMLALPGGARGRALGRGALAPAMSGLACWRSIGGISDGLLVAAGEPPPERVQAAPSLEDCLLPAWPGPFGWLVVAEPVPAAELEWLADETARGERLATGMADRFPDRDVEARRLRHRHTELRQGLSTGMWRVHLLAGGADPPAAARVASLVCASADLNGLPYTLAPAHSGPAGLRDLLGRPGPIDRYPATELFPREHGPAGGAHPQSGRGDTWNTAGAPPGFRCHTGDAGRRRPGRRTACPRGRADHGCGQPCRTPGREVAREHGAAGAGARPAADASGPTARPAGVTEPACFRVRSDRRREVPDRPGPAGGGHPGRSALAGGESRPKPNTA